MVKKEYAFPCIHEIDGNWNKEPLEEHRGMSLRDYFAAKAMQAYAADESWRIEMDNAQTARAAYRLADAMLEARKK